MSESLVDRLARLTPEQRALLLRNLPGQVPARTAVPRRDPAQPLALSPAQLRMWFLERVQAENAGSYNVYDYQRLLGPLDEDALLRAFREIVRRHEALRTSFIAVDGLPRQHVTEEVEFDFERHEAADEAAVQQIVDREPIRAFDLTTAPLMRVVLIRVGAEDHRLLITLHHIIADGWSLVVIQSEMRALYRAFRNGEPSPLAPLTVQFGDITTWQAQPEQQRKLDAQLAWWKETLAGVPDVLELPADRPRPPVQSLRGARARRLLGADLAAALDAFAQQQKKTPFMVLLAAFQTLLHRYSGQDSFAVGTPVANRKLTESEALVAMFVNTVAVRAELGDDPTFLTLLGRVRNTALDAFSHEEVPFDRVVDALGLERDASRTPLFQTMLVLAATHGAAGMLDGLQHEWIVPEGTTARFDLTLSVGIDAAGIDCVFDYAAALFDAPTIERFARHFEHLLREALAHPELPVSRLPLFDHAERTELLQRWNGALVARPEGATLHGLFIEQARRTPDAAAVVAPDRTVTYEELDRWTDDLASRIAASAGATTTVALLADRSIEAVAGVLAILKAGYAYLPIDPKTPADRLEWLLADAKATLLDEKQFLGVPRVPRSSSGTPRVPGNSEELRGTRGTASAYIIYTSGSTGTPKGVVVEHRSAVNLALSFAESHGFAGHRVLMIPPLPFDASVGDVFPAFATGAALVLHPSPGDLNAAELARYCAAHDVTAIDAPAALWRRWTEEWTAGAVPRSSSGSSEFLGNTATTEELRGTPRNPEELLLPTVTMMMVGGESVPAAEVRRFAQLTRGRVRFFNHYGPTEATVCATIHETVDASEVTMGELPIGKPLANVTAYVLDRHHEPVPMGVAGELYLGGIGVARGYHGRPAQTAERFLPDPFNTTPGARLYRTGDLARRLADGSLLFLGRSDRQIKLRGFRIEPGEIEAALLAHPDVRGAVVVLREQRLAGYVVSDKTSIRDTLAAYLRERLPEYMVPSAFVVLDALPLTSNGKIDLRALPEPPKPEMAGRVTAPPRNALEETLVAIWSEVLGREDVGIEDDFFAAGGDSLRTMPVIFKVQQQFGIELPLSAVFTAPTVARFAPLVENALHGRAEASLSLEERIGPPITITDAARAAQRPAGELPRAALLTGATGFLGAFLLDELLRATPATVYCLVRAKDPDDGLRRIRENLATYALTADLTRIVPLLGDLALPQLGLSEDVLGQLAETLDVIYHNGGTVNFVAPYETLEAANVDGTREVLRLAAASRIKPVHLVSTLGVHFTTPRIGLTVRESDDLPPGHDIAGGYNQSKWVADRVAQRARESGLPVSIHRPARITGDSRSGALNPGDFFYSWIQGCVELGAFPGPVTLLNMAPVDYIARAIVQLSLDGGAGDHHYFNNRTIPLDALVAELRTRGLMTEIVPFARWREALLSDPANALAKFAALMDVPDEGEPFFDCTETEERLAARGLTCPCAETLLPLYLDQLAARGLLAVPAGARA